MHSKITLPPADSEDGIIAQWLAAPVLGAEQQRQVSAVAEQIIRSAPPHESLADELMQTYPLNSREGAALMSLAEAMLRVPDDETRDALIYDKIPGRHWGVEEGGGRVRMTGAAMAALSGTLEGENAVVATAVSRLGMPVIRRVVQSAMKLFGGQFVMAETIDDALQHAQKADDTLYSFDMLGEGARDETAAARYLASYKQAIQRTAAAAHSDEVHANNGVSVKLSALYARYETRQRDSVLSTLLPRVLHLATLAKRGNIPLTLDAEEMARLPLSLEIIAALMAAPALQGYHGLGVAVQAYGLRAGKVLDALLQLAQDNKRGMAIRLIKGAYWDTEIKIAQQKGLATFPVFTHKAHTDLSFLHHAHRLLQAPDMIYPQFASHNATSLAAVQTMAQQLGGNRVFEVQRLYGMGAALHEAFRERFSNRLRVYAPVGSHDDLLAYLVRRLLENSANSSFIHRLHEKSLPMQELVALPYEQISRDDGKTAIKTGSALFLPQRDNSRGEDIDCPQTLRNLQTARQPHLSKQYVGRESIAVPSPADAGDSLHTPTATSAEEMRTIWTAAHNVQEWRELSAAQRGEIVKRIAAAYEDNRAEIYALLAREAGKTIDDAVDELREAVDFCLYYGAQGAMLPADAAPRGVVLAISPWNFPLAIFTGQIVAALAAGNAVVAKPAEQTPLIAQLAVSLMHHAGVPKAAVQLVHGDGETVGAALVGSGEADMVVFTGSTETARAINRAIAASAKPAPPLLAETGGINAMVVDSSALPEQAVDDILASAFRSAGQRCSALRVLYVQEDIADALLAMLTGAAALLKIGNPREMDTDIGPVIDAAAQREINDYVDARQTQLLWRAPPPPSNGCFVAPAILRVKGIGEVTREVFGPVLHVATYAAADFGRVLGDINSAGYGLTFGLHSRMESQQNKASELINAGNLYINRNQVGAVVGSQPFGGCGLSGTGPKAGGQLYLHAFTRAPAIKADTTPHLLPGPDGEENRYQCIPRGCVLCIAETEEAAQQHLAIATQAGNEAQWATQLPSDLSTVQAVMLTADNPALPAIRQQLAATKGAIIPLISDDGAQVWLWREKHISNDTTALGGNISLLTVSG